MFFEDIAPWLALIAALAFFLWLDLHYFARGREPNFKEAVWWSVGWLVLSLRFGIGCGQRNDIVGAHALRRYG